MECLITLLTAHTHVAAVITLQVVYNGCVCPIHSKKCSWGLKSGYLDGNRRTTMFFCRNAVVIRAVCGFALYCTNVLSLFCIIEGTLVADLLLLLIEKPKQLAFYRFLTYVSWEKKSMQHLELCVDRAWQANWIKN